VTLALALYPPWWRRHYGAEATAILEETPPTARAFVDVLRGAVDAWRSQRPPRHPFARFGDEARRIVVLAQKEAHELDHGYVGTEHILLALLAAAETDAARALTELGVSPETVRARLRDIVGQGVPLRCAPCSRKSCPPDLPKWSMRLTPRAKRGFALSCRAADRLGATDVDATHLLMGLLDEGGGVGAVILAALVDPAQLRGRLEPPGQP